MGRPIMPGVPPAGHLSDRGFWHPGKEDGCPKCEPPNGPRVFTVHASDVARCPRHSLSPHHYRDDGSCKCPND